MDSMLDGSVHVGNSGQMQDGSLVKLSKLQPSDEEMKILSAAVEDLKWRLDHEKGLHKEMVELLQKKVS